MDERKHMVGQRQTTHKVESIDTNYTVHQTYAQKHVVLFQKSKKKTLAALLETFDFAITLLPNLCKSDTLL